MGDIRNFTRSFNGGLLSPEFFGQVQDLKYQTGLAKCNNAIVTPHGPVKNRGGSDYVNVVKDSTEDTRTIPFAFSDEQTYAMEVGHQYIRFHALGGTVLAPGTFAWDIGIAYELGDTILHSGIYYYAKVDSTGVNPVGNPATWYALSNGILEIPTTYLSTDIFGIHYVQSNDVMSLTHPSYPPRELSRFVPNGGAYTSYSFKIENIAFGSTLAAPTGVSALPGVGVGVTIPIHYTYEVTALDDTGSNESLPSAFATALNDLTIAGNYNDVTWNAVAGATRYNVYLSANGLFGFIGQAIGLIFKDDNITPDLSQSPALASNPFNAVDSYPGEVSYFEQRRVFAATNKLPQNVWMTKSGTEKDLAYSIPLRDDDAVQFRVSARELNRIRHIVPLNDLVMLTSSSIWKVSSTTGGAITPISTDVKTPSYVGASNVRPALVDNTVIFEAARGKHWRELAYSREAGGYTSGDLALRAAHLFDGYNTIDMAYSESPYPIVWGTRSDGKMVGLTYVPDQKVGAFHEHSTSTLDGQSNIKSLCVVPEGDYDYIYAVVERVINGATVKYIERFRPHVFSDRENAYFVDCGVTYDSNPLAASKDITSITQANPAEVTLSGAHGLANGDPVDLRAILAEQNIPPANLILMSSLNGRQFKAANVTATTFELQTNEVTPVDVDTTGYTAYKRGGTAMKAISSITGGLDHLEGETVNVLANGAVNVDKTVVGGAITLDSPASIIQVGLPISTDLELLPLTVMVDAALGEGLNKNINKVWIRVDRTSGLSVGPNIDDVIEVKARTTEDYGQPPELKSEMLDAVDLIPEWDLDGSLVITQYHPLPMTIVSVAMEVTLGGG